MNAVRARPISKVLTVLGFVALFAGGFAYFWTQLGGETPGTGGQYQVAFRVPDAKNLQDQGDVSIAGVVIGHVVDRAVDGDRSRVQLKMNPDAPPLHEGATARIGVKSAIGQSYVDIVDGHGAPIPSGATLPDSAVKPAVDIDEVLAMLPPQTRQDLSGTLRSLGTATAGTHEDVSRLMSGLGKLGDQGHTALDAIAAQSEDLTALTGEANTLLNTLDTGRGQIADVVRDADTLTEATAGQRGAIENTVRGLPRLLDSAKTATGKVGELSGSLAPVAADLNRAAPDLNQALVQLPPVTSDVRALLPALNGTIDAAPATLDRVPTLGSDVRELIPDAHAVLRDVNPMLSYLEPYGRDIGSMFASFGASMNLTAENGVRPVRLTPVFGSPTVRGNPVPLTLDPTHWNNPYPLPGHAGNPAPFQGPYPRLEREPN